MKITIVISVILLAFVGYFAFFTKEATLETENTIPISSDFLSMGPEIAALPSQNISDDENSGLLYMREEEKLARDVYITLYKKWNLPIFDNISQSEQTHTESVRTVLIKYSIQDPVTDDAVGVFKNTDLKNLYNDLIKRGLLSVNDALTVGALIEDLDINDLQEQIAKTDNEDISLVYENLLRGSRNHLRSFVGQLASRNITYKPEYITQEELDSILSTPKENGSDGSTRGWVESENRL